MLPLANRLPSIKPVTAARLARTTSLPAPRRGWVRNENLAKHKPEGATVLENWFPTATGARVRRGSTKYATIGAGAAVGAIMSYLNGNLAKLFAANGSAIYDITTVANANVSPAAAVSGLTSGDWSYVQFANASGVYLVCVNGADTRQIYDGSAWTTSPSITWSGAAFSHVWAWKQRLFFIEKGTLNAAYLAADALGGTATRLNLGGVFKLGGSLLFGATWSYESAGSGLADACVFVTTEGEAAIYEGTDPSSASTWALKGVYRIGRPLGKNASMKAGGDLAIATDIGLVALSSALTRDQAALNNGAVSYPIEEEWKKEAIQRRAQFSWSVALWPTQQMALVQMPTYSTLSAQCFVVNIQTGAWSLYSGWDTRCLGLFQDRMFFGTSTGTVIEAEVGGSDQGSIYVARYVGLFEDLSDGAANKIVTGLRPQLLTTLATNVQASVSTEYVVSLPSPPSVTAVPAGSSLWNFGVWNQSVWGSTSTKFSEGEWQTVSGVGQAIAPNLQISIGGGAEPQIELVSLDLAYQVGSPIG
jgi:hypothetical protein